MSDDVTGEEPAGFVSPNLKLDVKFLRLAFDAPDFLGKVLRTHLEIEAQIERLIHAHTGMEFEDGTEFSVKCLVLQAMGWPEGQLKTIRRFGTLRNKFAHKKPEGKVERQINSLRELIIREHGMQMVDDLDRFTFALDRDEPRSVATMADDEKLVVVGAMLAFLLSAALDTHAFRGLVPKVRFEAPKA